MKNFTIWQFGLRSDAKQEPAKVVINDDFAFGTISKVAKQGNVTIQIAAESLEDAVKLLTQIPKAADMRVLTASQNGSVYTEDAK